MTSLSDWFHALVGCLLGIINPTLTIRYLIKHSNNVRWQDGKYLPTIAEEWHKIKKG